MNEYGPFELERDALATRSAALIRAAFDANPGVGASVPESLKVMTDACETHGDALGKWDLGFLKGVAWGETANAVSLAGMIRRAYEAGLAARDEAAEVEWGVRFSPGSGRPRDLLLGTRDDAQETAGELRKERPEWGAAVVVREPERPAGPWKLAPGEDGADE
jgi:hypothetical protein